MLRGHRLFILMALTALLITACGASATASDTTGSSSVVPSATHSASATATPSASPTPTVTDKVTLTIESWRNDDGGIWQNTIIPAFEKTHPKIHLVFQATAPGDYQTVLNNRLRSGTAGDLISCRPFDASLKLFEDGRLAALNDLGGLDNFTALAKSSWTTDDGTTTFCVPIASVIHGFIYNREVFDQLGLRPPTTQDEFIKVLEVIKRDGRYVPLAMGTADRWEAATMGFQNIGPSYWKGEQGREALINGTQKFTAAPYVEAWRALQQWKSYLPPRYQSLHYPDAQRLFTMGKAAIYPAGSWEIPLFSRQSRFKLGAFKPPVASAGDQCYISDQPDIGIGLNAKARHPAEAREFLRWLTTSEFAELYSNALPGFFSLNKNPVKLQDPLAQEFSGWRQQCESTIRNSYQMLSRGQPNLETELWRVSAQVLDGTLTLEQAAQEVQAGLDKWYTPAE